MTRHRSTKTNTCKKHSCARYLTCHVLGIRGLIIGAIHAGFSGPCNVGLRGSRFLMRPKRICAGGELRAVLLKVATMLLERT